MKNAEIRRAIADKGVKYWQVAAALNITDGSFSRKLREELSKDDKRKILDAIQQLRPEKPETPDVRSAAVESLGNEQNHLPTLAISVEDAAGLLGISRPTMSKLTNQADFPSFKIGRRTLVSVEGLRQWIRKQVENK